MVDEFDEWGPLPPERDRSRFAKLIRLLMEISIAGFLIGLLLPFMTSNPDRHHARSSCLSNLRQLGLGILTYANFYHDLLPPGTMPNPALPLERRLGWGVPILPFIDLPDYYHDRGLSPEQAERLAWDDRAFADLMKEPPYMTHCRVSEHPASYVAIAGLGVDAPSLPTADSRAGIFGDDRRVTLADIKDGTFATMMLTEATSVPGPWFAGGRMTVRGLDPARSPYLGANGQFGGNHPGGANVLFADGSARFLSESIDPKIFEALSTMAGGEMISPIDLN